MVVKVKEKLEKTRHVKNYDKLQNIFSEEKEM